MDVGRVCITIQNSSAIPIQARTIPIGGYFRIVDLISTNVLGLTLSDCPEMEFCLDALQMAWEGGYRAEIFSYSTLAVRLLS